MSSYYSHLIGNEPNKLYLTRMVENKAIANSLLFAGPSGIGKGLFAQTLAAQLIGMQNNFHAPHPDIHHYQPEGKLGLHTINSLRQLISEIHLPPYQAPWKVFIIHEAERMLSYSSNALLKTFEEPPEKTVIILISQSPEALLPTIKSRCRTLHFHALKEIEIANYLMHKLSLDENTSLKYAAQSRGSLSRAIELAERKGDPSRKLVLDILAKGCVGLYKELGAYVKAISEQIEGVKKEAEIKAKAAIEGFQADELTAVQKHALEKELEGAVTVSFMTEARAIFDHILSWYRDLQLIQIKGDKRKLFNPDYYDDLCKCALRCEVVPIEKVEVMIKESIFSLQRSTGFNICIENLFIKLNLI